MARPIDTSKKEQFWKNHIHQARHYEGGISKYCQSQGLNTHTFKYWKSRLSKKLSESRLPALSSSFIPVQLENPKRASASGVSKSLPDPKWLAEVLFELHARVSNEVP